LEENLLGQSSNHQIFKSTNPQITQTYQVGRKPVRTILKSSNHQIFKSTNPQITQTYQVGRKPVRTIIKSSNHQIIKSINHPDLSGWKKTC